MGSLPWGHYLDIAMLYIFNWLYQHKTMVEVDPMVEVYMSSKMTLKIKSEVYLYTPHEPHDPMVDLDHGVDHGAQNAHIYKHFGHGFSSIRAILAELEAFQNLLMLMYIGILLT